MSQISDDQLENQISDSLLRILAAARLSGRDTLEKLSRKMITIGGAGYQEAVGAERTAESFYRMADNLAVEIGRK